jgi:hypothetical protein
VHISLKKQPGNLIIFYYDWPERRLPRGMKYEVYGGIKVTADFSVFDFASIGKNGIIPKRIAFVETEIYRTYAFMDQGIVPFVKNLKIDAFLVKRKIF